MNFETHLKSYLKKRLAKTAGAETQLLKQSIIYSLLAKSSRFRPKLVFASTKILNRNSKSILPWAIAIELIHSASLIHDDLPTMDNAKTRRGKKCNHLKFGEDIALLAGSCLFVESFALLSAPLFHKKRTELLKLLTDKAGFQGLMSGQALDLRFSSTSKQKLFKMITLKTGSLIEASILGPALLWGKEKEKKVLQSYSQYLGLAYQLKDDLKDQDGFFKSKKQLKKEISTLIKKALFALKPLGNKTKKLEQLSLSYFKKELS